MHILNDDQVIEMIAVNETVYEYSFNETECETYRLAVYAVNEAVTTCSSKPIASSKNSTASTQL